MKKTLIAIVLALALTLIPVSSALAANPETATVTCTPVVLSIDLGATGDWPVNNVGGGDALVRPDTLYYSNPVGDETAPSGTVLVGECHFTFTNLSNVAIDITCNMSDFVGGDASTNSDGGYTSNGATTFGASGYYEGGAWTGGAVTFQVAGSGLFIDALDESGGADDDIMWGIAMTTQSDDFTLTTNMVSTVTCTATED